MLQKQQSLRKEPNKKMPLFLAASFSISTVSHAGLNLQKFLFLLQE